VLKVPTVRLGSTGLAVSRIGFGTFDFGDPSLKISPEKGAKILAESYRFGINFWDSSDDYGSHPHIASALKYVPRKRVVISTKIYTKSGKKAERDLKSILKELGTDYLDIFLLHYVASDWIKGSHLMLKQMKDLIATGTVKAIGLSTHSVAVAAKAAQFDELDVIMAVCCKADPTLIKKFKKHIPLEDGSMDEMFHALELAHNNGKGVIAMKVLGGGARAPLFAKDYRKAIEAVSQLGFVDSIVIGMKNLDEVKKNVKVVASS